MFDAAASWIELADFLPAVMAGVRRPGEVLRCVCAAGHKAMYSRERGGLPSAEFLARLDPRLGALRARLSADAWPADRPAGRLCAEWAQALGLQEGIPVAMGGFDAHYGAVGAGVAPGTLVKIIGTSTCDIAVAPAKERLADIPGICGIVPGSVMPGCYGIEAGQSAVGDLLAWWAGVVASAVGEARGCGPASPACWRSTGTTATAPSSWTSGSPGWWWGRRCTRRRRKCIAR